MIKVAAAIIENDGKIFVCKRGAGGVCAFLWEFPGGKLEEGETPNEALCRECREELEVKIEPEELFAEFPFKYPDREIYFYFIKAKIKSGEIKLNVHTAVKWVLPEEMNSAEYCPADKDIIALLKENYGQGV